MVFAVRVGAVVVRRAVKHLSSDHVEPRVKRHKLHSLVLVLGVFLFRLRPLPPLVALLKVLRRENHVVLARVCVFARPLVVASASVRQLQVKRLLRAALQQRPVRFVVGGTPLVGRQPSPVASSVVVVQLVRPPLALWLVPFVQVFARMKPQLV